VRYYFHNAICTLHLICSKRQPDDDSIAPKNVAVLILHIVVLDGYLLVSYFVVQHNRMHNFKIVYCKVGDKADNTYQTAARIAYTQARARARTHTHTHTHTHRGAC
jgi:hypothetical protein